MSETDADARRPVIVGVGELADRPSSLDAALEPAALMTAALELAQADAGAPLLPALDRLDVINEVSWPYADPCGEVLRRIGRPGLPGTHHPVGGQTPLLALHEAALRIASGETEVEAVCGAEAQRSVLDFVKAGRPPPWSPRDPDARPLRGGDHQSAAAKALDLATPAHVYPFYEAATRAAWGMSLAEAQAESGRIWAANAAVARGRDTAWIRREVRRGGHHALAVEPSDRLALHEADGRQPAREPGGGGDPVQSRAGGGARRGARALGPPVGRLGGGRTARRPASCRLHALPRHGGGASGRAGPARRRARRRLRACGAVQLLPVRAPKWRDGRSGWATPPL